MPAAGDFFELHTRNDHGTMFSTPFVTMKVEKFSLPAAREMLQLKVVTFRSDPPPPPAD